MMEVIIIYSKMYHLILRTFARDNKIDESIFKAMLTKMGLSKSDFDTNMEDMSEGQKKKVLIAKSISDVFVEHDETFIKKVATKIISIEK